MIIKFFDDSNKELDYDMYLNDTSISYIFKLNYKQTIHNDENCISLCLLENDNDNIITNIENKHGIEYTFYSNNTPKKYYYDNDLYGENYFVCLPGESQSSEQLDNSSFSPNYIVDNTSGICCLKKGLHKIGTIDDNINKKPYDIELYSKNEIKDENDYRLKHLKLGKIPDIIYKNIKTFMNVKETPDNNYKNLELSDGHIYRLGIIEDSNISSFILSILYTMKYENIKTLYKTEFLNTEKYFTIDSIKSMLNKYIDSLSIDDLINLNDGMYIKLPNNLVEASKLVDYSKKKSLVLETNSIETYLKNEFKNYFDNNFNNLDINLIWDIMIDIFKINIIIIEVQYENDINKSSVKCPNINRKTGLFDKNINKYCLLFSLKIHINHLLFLIKIVKTFKILFNINESSKSNIEKLYNKCLLKYNDTLYNNVIINSVYNNINIDNFIILSDNDLIDLINQT